MENNLLSRLSLSYKKGKENVKLEIKKRDLENEKSGEGRALIMLEIILSENPALKDTSGDNTFYNKFKEISENQEKIVKKLNENYTFPQKWIERLAYNLGYFFS